MSSLLVFFTTLLTFIGNHLTQKRGHLQPHGSYMQSMTSLAEETRYNDWGSYRGNLYFGLRTKAPHSIMTGLFWYGKGIDGQIKARHFCDLNDQIRVWGWQEHDGESFGRQLIEDIEFNAVLDIQFTISKPKGTWSSRIQVSPLSSNQPFDITVGFYLADEHQDGRLKFEKNRATKRRIMLKGWNSRNKAYYLEADSHDVTGYGLLLAAPQEMIWDATALLSIHFKRADSLGEHQDKIHENFAALLYEVSSSTQLDFYFSQGFYPAIADYEAKSARFHSKFDEKFASIPEASRKACEFALSNLLGGISYFYGTSFVLMENEIESKVVESEPFELFTDIPSRATFPRGFLWDSGFHNLLISEWDPKLSLEIIKSWSHRIEHNGWIAREQIPGIEARRAVPVDYIIQNTKHANPPAILLTFHKLANIALKSGNEKEKNFIITKLRHLLPLFEKNLKWLIRTQKGTIHPSFCYKLRQHCKCSQVLKLPAFRWRGRKDYHNLNSGLDDYPRSSFPNKYELHLDISCWVAFGLKTVLSSYKLLGMLCEKKKLAKYTRLYRGIRGSMDKIHLDAERGLYSDVSISQLGTLRHVEHEGYVSLFPFIFGFIEPESPLLKPVLDLIEDQSKLWTDYGLRSLSKSDPFYMKGDQYWTGPIWININYLVLSALKNHYMKPDGIHIEQVNRIYTRLRANIVENMIKEYERTGTIWEQYSDVDGQGLRSRPFTGWSALLVLIAAEIY